MKCNLMSPRALQWLACGRPARVLHLFDEVCNLVNDQGELVSLVTQGLGPGPFTLVLEGDFRSGLTVEQPVQVDPGRQGLSIGPRVIEWKQAAVWQPKPEWEQLQVRNCNVWPAPAVLAPDIQRYLGQALEGIVFGNVEAVRESIFGLAGRGSGLTPTGDDVLMGLLYGLWVWNPRPDWMALVANTAAPRTTTLSANFIRAAAAGEAVWQWHELVNGRSGAIDQIIAMGHSSGADALAGFVAACEVFGKRPSS